MQPPNDAENLFLDEIRAKKKETASWRDSQKHKRMGKGSIRFPSDFMSRKERIEHRRAGTVTTTNIFDVILPMEEFDALETHEKKNRMQYWRTKYTIKEIQTGMGIYQKRFYDIIDSLDLPKDRGHSKPRTPRKAKIAAEPQNQNPNYIEYVKEETPAPIVQMPAPVVEVVEDGMHLVFKGTYTPEELQRQLLKYAGLLDDESDKYYVEMKMIQKPSAK